MQAGAVWTLTEDTSNCRRPRSSRADDKKHFLYGIQRKRLFSQAPDSTRLFWSITSEAAAFLFGDESVPSNA